jgi:OHCU decarboxylase
MNAVLAHWNACSESDAIEAMLVCCGARRWAQAMVAARPIAAVAALSETADKAWATMSEQDWLEAFSCHPRIGERKAAHASPQSGAWSQQEQSAVATTQQRTLDALARGNAQYEDCFGFTYIVCATGKSGEEMLAILTRRLTNSREVELLEASEQQRQILQIRLGKWLTT